MKTLTELKELVEIEYPLKCKEQRQILEQTLEDRIKAAIYSKDNFADIELTGDDVEIVKSILDESHYEYFVGDPYFGYVGITIRVNGGH